MASGWTNRGKFAMLDYFCRGTDPLPVSVFKLALVKTTPDQDDNTFADVTEVAAGNGYTAGGETVNQNATDWDVLTEDDTNDRALCQIKDIVWTASGGDLPSDSAGATFAILTDDNGTQSARNIFFWWDLGGARVVSDTQTLTIQDAEIRINHV